MFKTIKTNCEACPNTNLVMVPSYCKDCHSKKFDFTPKKSKFWLHIKKLSYTFLLYSPGTYYIGLRFGLKIEFIYFLGGIHLIILPLVIDWLMKKF